MTSSSPDGSRDRRIEDPSNLWLIHPAGRALLPHAVMAGVSANTVSLLGFCLGAAAAAAYANWQNPWMAFAGLLLSIGWLIADGLDGMIARATGTASALGRALDGLCDHGVFVLIYVAMALSIGTREAWVLAVVAGVAHAVGSSLYEGERARFHRRVRGTAATSAAPLVGGPLVMLYDSVAHSMDRMAAPFERLLDRAADPATLGRDYGDAATPAMKLLSLMTANVRVGMIFLACLLGNPRIFWWFEIVPLTIVAVIGMARHRRIERAFVRGTMNRFTAEDLLAPAYTSKEHRR